MNLSHLLYLWKQALVAGISGVSYFIWLLCGFYVDTWFLVVRKEANGYGWPASAFNEAVLFRQLQRAWKTEGRWVHKNIFTGQRATQDSTPNSQFQNYNIIFQRFIVSHVYQRETLQLNSSRSGGNSAGWTFLLLQETNTQQEECKFKAVRSVRPSACTVVGVCLTLAFWFWTGR